MNCEVKQSKIDNAGLGVFSLRQFKRGDIVCKYGGKFYSEWPEGIKDTYVLNVLGGILVGDPKILIGNDIGHMINDPVYVPNFNSIKKKFPNLFNFLESIPLGLYFSNIMTYIESSIFQTNVVEDINGLIIATKDINIGDEILMSYGLKYWIGNTPFSQYYTQKLSEYISKNCHNLSPLSVYDCTCKFNQNFINKDNLHTHMNFILKHPIINVNSGLIE